MLKTLINRALKYCIFYRKEIRNICFDTIPLVPTARLIFPAIYTRYLTVNKDVITATLFFYPFIFCKIIAQTHLDFRTRSTFHFQNLKINTFHEKKNLLQFLK